MINKGVIYLCGCVDVMGEKYLDIRALYAQTDMFLFDPGYTITGSCASAISYMHSSGTLLYRGYTI